jgi:hypothetical protein
MRPRLSRVLCSCLARPQDDDSVTRLWISEKVTKSYQKLPKVTKSYQKLPKVTKSYQKLPKDTKSYQKLPKDTKSYQKLPKVTKSYQKLPKVTKSYQKLPKVTKSYYKLPKVSQDQPKCALLWNIFTLEHLQFILYELFYICTYLDGKLLIKTFRVKSFIVLREKLPKV